MWKFLRGGATVIQGATFIPESRVARVLGRNLPNRVSGMSFLYPISICFATLLNDSEWKKKSMIMMGRYGGLTRASSWEGHGG